MVVLNFAPVDSRARYALNNQKLMLSAKSDRFVCELIGIPNIHILGVYLF